MRGAHRPQHFVDPDQSLFLLRKKAQDGGPEDDAQVVRQFNTKDIRKANEMESFLVWDATRGCTHQLELAAYPVLSGASKDERLERAVPDAKNLRGKWETLARCGHVFLNAESLKFIIADGHGSHLWLRQLLLGQKISLAQDLLVQLPFWSKLSVEDLPLTCIPMPWRLVRVDGETIHYIPGEVLKYVANC